MLAGIVHLNLVNLFNNPLFHYVHLLFALQILTTAGEGLFPFVDIDVISYMIARPFCDDS